jgi:hypothetical protein
MDMKPAAAIRSLALAAFTLFAACEVSAVALTGGVVSLIGRSGSCNSSQLTPLDTPQDTFALAVSTACNGGSASGELRSDASTASVGPHTTVSGTGAQAAAEVSLVDQWAIGVPVGIASGSVFTLPAAFRLEGDIAPGSTFGASLGRFLDYSISLGQFGHGRIETSHPACCDMSVKPTRRDPCTGPRRLPIADLVESNP